MNKLFAFLLIIIPNLLFGQKTKLVKDKKNSETYHVLKSDNGIKQGEYDMYGFDHHLMVKGFYKQGVKDSIWESYDYDGNVNLKYDYTHHKLLNFKHDSLSKKVKYKVINSDSSDTVLSRPPIFFGGNLLLAYMFSHNLRYPKLARDNGKMGRVEVAFTVNKLGKVNNYHVLNYVGYGLDEEAIRVMELLPDYWIPGVSNDKPVDVEVVIPVIFQLQEVGRK